MSVGWWTSFSVHSKGTLCHCYMRQHCENTWTGLGWFSPIQAANHNRSYLTFYLELAYKDSTYFHEEARSGVGLDLLSITYEIRSSVIWHCLN